ncbi:tetratricopeptide repeat protein [Marseilla massiliensis]|uniref:Tetratricopeptide repeat protein n=1 Tax=Marseilla massiliensis TaxID=1841864 RepID=A0A938WW79_9BACT|nr:tetratricopeptide repeat protein [Marseilla massiliensis]MBM6674811.1 tetratricopeptide repeat protein [Marseilla massiliensis]
MKRQILYVLACMAVTVIMVGCGSKGVVAAQPEGRSVPVMHLPAISHNDSLRFKMYYYEAVKQQISGNYDAAYDLLEHCIGINPNAAEAYFMLSFYDGILKGDSAAFADVKKASELNPTNNAYLERIGVGYVSMGNLDEAVKAYEKLSRNSPERSDVLDFLAQLYSRQKDYDKMLDVLNRMEALEGASEDLTLAKMRVYSLQGKKEEEYNELKNMSEKHPNDMNYRVMLGNWLLQNGKPDEAGKLYLEVLQAEPENIMARMSMIDYYRTSGQAMRADSLQEVMLVSPKTPVDGKMALMRQVVADNEKNGADSTLVIDLFKKILKEPQETSDMAQLYAAYLTLKKMPQDSISKVLETVLAISPDNVAARLQLIQAEWNKQDFDRVIELSNQALDYSPDELAFYYFLGFAYIQKDDDDSALKVLRRGVSQINDQSNPSLVSDFYAIMGDILHDKGDDKGAYAAYDSCLQWKDDNYGCLNNYAYYLSVENKDLDKAAQMSYRTVQAEPDNSTFLDTYAWILFMQKKYAEALQYIDMAVKNDTTKSAVIIEHAGDIHAVNGDIDGAVKYWNEALKAGAENETVLRRKIKLRKYVEK